MRGDFATQRHVHKPPFFEQIEKADPRTRAQMTILFLGPTSPTFEYLCAVESYVFRETAPLTAAMLTDLAPDFLVSHGYRHKITPDVIAAYPFRIVNLHISYLPWNKGADPNLWSFLEDTPKGVTIHDVDAGIDTGPILAQRLVAPQADDTLATMYQRLQETITALFIETWPHIRQGTDGLGAPQREHGSAHRQRDKAPYLHLLTHGWETPVAALPILTRTEPSTGFPMDRG